MFSRVSPFTTLILVMALSATLLASPAPTATAQSEKPLVDVALDPGHSTADVGAVGGGLAEYQVALDLAQRTRLLLEAQHYTVRLTREDSAPLTDLSDPSSDAQIQLEQQARIDAATPARVFVSLHFNGGPPSLRGTETYYNIDRGGDGSTDKVLAETLQRDVIGALAWVGYTSPDRGAKSDLWDGKPYGHFFSLRGPMPSVLLESLFLTNPGEAALLQRSDVLDALAAGVAQGVEDFLGGVPAGGG